jgi:hypothetical protein
VWLSWRRRGAWMILYGAGWWSVAPREQLGVGGAVGIRHDTRRRVVELFVGGGDGDRVPTPQLLGSGVRRRWRLPWVGYLSGAAVERAAVLRLASH